MRSKVRQFIVSSKYRSSDDVFNEWLYKIAYSGVPWAVYHYLELAKTSSKLYGPGHKVAMKNIGNDRSKAMILFLKSKNYKGVSDEFVCYCAECLKSDDEYIKLITGSLSVSKLKAGDLSASRMESVEKQGTSKAYCCLFKLYSREVSPRNAGVMMDSLYKSVMIEPDQSPFLVLSLLKSSDNEARKIIVNRCIGYSSGGSAYFKLVAGIMYREGVYIKKDLAESRKLLEASYGSGLSFAALGLFDLLFESDDKTDFDYMLKAIMPLTAEGNGGAMGRLGRAYRDGKGVERDLNEAANWMRKAAEKKVSWAKDELSVIESLMNRN